MGNASFKGISMRRVSYYQPGYLFFPGTLFLLLLLVQCKKDLDETPPVNTPPVAELAFSPNVGTTATVFSFDASACQDAQDHVKLLQVRWDLDGDGNWDTSFDTLKTATHQYAQAGSYTVKVEVKDRGGLTAMADTVIVVGEAPPVNTPPVAAFTISPSSGTPNTTFFLDASPSHDQQDSTKLLKVRWDFNNDGNWDTPFSTVKTATYQYNQIGTHTLRLEVIDKGGLTDINEKTLQVLDLSTNTPPTALFSVSPLIQPEYTNFDLNASSSYDNQDPASALQVRWDFENDGVWDTPYSHSKTTHTQYGQAGTYTIRMEVKDSGGLTDDTTAVATVIPSPNGVPCPGTPTVTYAGQTYNTVKIGTQCWFKENLNVGTRIDQTTGQHMANNGIIEKYCPCTIWALGDSFCNIYGAIYQWDEAMQYTNVEGAQGICPPGWHIPSDNDWKILFGTVDSQYGAGDPIWNQFGYPIGFDVAGHLKYPGYPYFRTPNACGTNSSGFSAYALPCVFDNQSIGMACSIAVYGVQSGTPYWSSTEVENKALGIALDHKYCGIIRYLAVKITVAPIRCIKDN